MKKMNCQQFQEILPYIIESGGKAEEEKHLDTCAACAELVRDLRYIADQAKLLVPMHDPNPRVWTNIEQSLMREGLLTEGRMSPPGHIKKNSTPIQTKNFTPLGWALAITTLVVFAVALVNYRPQLPTGQLSAQNSSAEPAQFDGDDQQLISRMTQDPAARDAYESNLREVNAYITDARKAAEIDPADSSAQELLQNAYEQKEMLYQMATARSLP